MMGWELFLQGPLFAVFLGNAFIAVGGAVVGTFAVLRREGMLADVLAHAVVPGIGFAYLLSAQKELPMLALGAFLTALAAAGAVELLRRMARLSEDSRLGVVLAASFGLGIVLLTLLQSRQGPDQTGLWRFLFGQAAAVRVEDLPLIVAVTALSLLFVAIAFRELVAMAFDAEFLRALPLPLQWVEVGYRVAVVAITVVGIQSVGALLIVGLFVLPPMAARLWVRRVPGMLVGSVAVALGAVVVGLGLSWNLPYVATGPVIVTAAAGMVLLSHLFAPHRGVLARAWGYGMRWLRRWDEHAHKLLYYGIERSGGECWEGPILRPEYGGSRAGAVLVLVWLWLRGSIRWEGRRRWRVTKLGHRRACQIVRRHRLWELYLERFFGVPADRVHLEAELVEHVLSPEIEERLQELLQQPEHDPHGRPIPPRQNG
ncbi:MAG: metal ABC transporter permease [Candidatus Kapabacteria bacterium]|nr:metal ABC transporter permease [Candidatus Kapabacteria bacterium]MDW8012399.1 metal ABC transporter permease [Bacteroidota bacterium]